MTKFVPATLLALSLLVPTAASAVDASLSIDLGSSGDFERRQITYDCADGEPLVVTYINAAPNFLALVPLANDPDLHIFASVVSASGARYASGQWVWWTKGAEASLYDATLGEDAPAVLTCSEMNNTP